MAKLTLEDLRKLREGKRTEIARRESHKEIRIVIGMGTCGIAAGAKEAFDSFIAELAAQNIDAVVQQTGCMGFCYAEPTVEIQVPDMPTTIYGKVNATVARTIVQKHIKGKELVSEHIFDKPSVDIMAQKKA